MLQQIRSSEGGFTLVELIGVMVVLAIMLTMSAQLLRSPDKPARNKQLLVAAQAYVDAVEGFQQDHGGRVPSGIGDRHEAGFQFQDWSSAVQNGPHDVTNRPDDRPRRYMRSGVSELFSNGNLRVAVEFTNRPGGQAGSGDLEIRYRQRSTTTYEIIVTDRTIRPGTPGHVCAFSNHPNPSVSARC